MVGRSEHRASGEELEIGTDAFLVANAIFEGGNQNAPIIGIKI